MQLRELQWSRAPKSKYTANSPTNRDSRKLFTDFNSVNTDQNLYSSNSNPAVTVGLAVPRSLTREGVVGPDLRVRTSVFLAWAISSLGSRLPNMYQGGRYSSKSRASYTPPCQSHEVSNAHPTLPSTKSNHNEFQDSRHNAHGTTTVRIDASQSKSTILRKFQNSFRTESEIHCRFVPSWDGCSIPVPRRAQVQAPSRLVNRQFGVRGPVPVSDGAVRRGIACQLSLEVSSTGIRSADGRKREGRRRRRVEGKCARAHRC